MLPAHDAHTGAPEHRGKLPLILVVLAVVLGFLLQWPTLLTLLMFPVLVVMYVRLARHEERDASAEFGDAYRRYAEVTPGWLPRFGVPGRGMRSDGRPA